MSRANGVRLRICRKLINNGDKSMITKKAIAAVSFGTTYKAARAAIESIEAALADAMPEYDTFRAFTSRMVVDKIEREEGVHIPSLTELLERLLQEGYTEVICQSLHVIAGREYGKLLEQTAPYAMRFERFAVGNPLLTDIEDYFAVRDALGFAPDGDTAYALMGHGSEHPMNAAYSQLENAFRAGGFENVFIGTVEGFPGLDFVIDRLKRSGLHKVNLAPLMIVAGEHAKNDMAGDDSDSWASRLRAEGYSVEVSLNGLGENRRIRDIFINHCRFAHLGGKF
jgi:sirohydrochlorin cobaltochelatase